MTSGRLLSLLAAWLLLASAAHAQDDAGHDRLVPRAPDGAAGKAMCEFCHAPHVAGPSQALWSDAPGVTYRLYESSTLQASLDQPTGASRLCLSCHDGTTALSTFPDRLGGQPSSRVAGRSLLGTDLSDDHPISFTYDAALAARNGHLAEPALLPRAVALDEARQLQCTTCHNPHGSGFEQALVEDPRFSQLCLRCHRLDGWSSSAHATSPATWPRRGIVSSSSSETRTVAENGCSSCHRSHSAERPEWLLRSRTEEKNCLVCHDGSLASSDIERESKKLSAHPFEQTEWLHTPVENFTLMERHVTCTDCHDPHGVAASLVRSTAPTLPPALRGARGINVSGTRVTPAALEYEVCFACHGLTEQPKATLIRQDHVTNVRLETDPANASYHPVVAPGKNHDVSGFEPGYTTASTLYCTDCHNSDTPASVGGVRGPHGSMYEPILEREYQMTDPSPESFQAYALCYKCHNRASLLSDQGGFPHRRHVVELQTSCAACHDAHGSRRQTRLINFMTTGKSGNAVVSPSSAGRLEFEDLGRFAGRCFLSCHGSDHNPKTYPR